MDRASWQVPLLLALITTACAGLGDSTSPLAAPGSSPSAAASPAEPTPLMPTPEKIGEEARLALTFPDGSEALVAYPSHLELAEMGVQPDVDLGWDGRWIGAIVFSHGGPVEGLLARADAVHRAEDPPVEEWTARPRGGRHQSTTRWLVFRLPSWTVHVPMDEPMEAGDLLGRVRPYETDDGFVAIDVSEPVELREGYGEAGGPQLAFGDTDPLPDLVRPGQDGLLVDMAPSNCGSFQAPAQVYGSYGSACLSGELFVNATSFSDTDRSRQKLANVVGQLRLVELEPAG